MKEIKILIAQRFCYDMHNINRLILLSFKAQEQPKTTSENNHVIFGIDSLFL